MRGVEQIPWLYDLIQWFMEAMGLRSWRHWLVGGARGRTLEVGCGTGRNLPQYPEGLTVIGIDPEPHALRRARRRAPGVPLVQASLHALPFKPQVFDTVVSSLVFCSVPDPMAGLAEIKRVLAPGGGLRMLEHVRSEGKVAGPLDDLIQPAWTWVAGGCHPNRRTEQTLEQGGFVIQPQERRAKGSMRRFTARPR